MNGYGQDSFGDEGYGGVDVAQPAETVGYGSSGYGAEGFGE